MLWFGLCLPCRWRGCHPHADTVIRAEPGDPGDDLSSVFGAAGVVYWLAWLGSGGCAGPSMSTLPWSSRNGGYRSVINAI
jgi:hypothetical protein